jgi:preprotein translocase subunit SecE
MASFKEVSSKFTAYLGEVQTEFKKISWPDRNELMDSTTVVITFIVILAVVVAVFDKVILFFLQLMHA